MAQELAALASLAAGARDVTWQPEADTRDGVLVDRKPRTAVLPLALSEWRSDPRGGTLSAKTGS